MAVKGTILASLVSAICFVTYPNSDKTNSETMTKEILTNSKVKNMNSVTEATV